MKPALRAATADDTSHTGSAAATETPSDVAYRQDLTPLAHLTVDGARPEPKRVPAVITAYGTMNDDRRDEIEARLDDVLDLDTDRWLDADGVDWDTVRAATDEADQRLVDVLAERYERPRDMLLRVRLAPDDGMHFEPGDYGGLQFPGTPRRVYSIANAPLDSMVDDSYRAVLDELDGPVQYGSELIDPETLDPENVIELCIRRIPDEEATDRSLTPQLSEKLEEYPVAQLSGAYEDELSLEPPSEHDMVFVATGTGIAPLRSMIHHVFDTGQDWYNGEERDVWLFLGASWEDDLPYGDEFREMGAVYDNFHPVLTASREEYLNPDWDGETAYVQQCLLKYVDPEQVDETAMDAEYRDHLAATPAYDIDARIDPDNTEMYVCGLGAMAEGVRSAAEAIGLPDDRYQEELFE